MYIMLKSFGYKRLKTILKLLVLVVPRLLYFKSKNPLYDKYRHKEAVVKTFEGQEKVGKPKHKRKSNKKDNKNRILVCNKLNPDSEERDNAEGKESGKNRAV